MSWLADASANRIVKSYIKDFVDISGNFKVRNEVSTTVNGPVSWSQLGSNLTEDSGDKLGYSVSMSDDGTRVAVGAVHNNGAGSNSGLMQVYEYNGSSWIQLGGNIYGISPDHVGWSVSISKDGTRAAAGGVYHAEYRVRSCGVARMYEYNGSSWIQLGSDIDGDSADDHLGWSISLNSDGSRVAIASLADDNNGSNSGSVSVYEYSGSSWSRLGSIINGESGGDRTFSVSLNNDGTIVAIGSEQNDGNGSDSGSVRVYQYSGSSWSQLGADIDGEAGNDRSGRSVSLSSDGTILAIGAILNDGNGSDSGHVRVYEYSGGSWSQLGADIDGEASGDQSGSSVSLNSDGTILAVGATFNDGYSSNAGHVRIYEYDGSSWNQSGADIDGSSSSGEAGKSVSLSGDGSRVIMGAWRGSYAQVYNKTGGLVTSQESKEVVDVSGGIVSFRNNTMKIEDGTVDISGTTWINQGQSGASIASSNQGAFIIESAGTSSSNSVVYVETAGQTQAFSIRENGDLYSANALQHSSDDRRKTNEQYITNATETIQKLSPQIYTKLNDLVQNGGTPTKTESGLIAQEIYYNAPELRHLVHIEDSAGNKLTPQEYDLSGNDIQNDPDYTALGWGNKSATVNYTGLIPYLIKSNQEQQAMIDNKKQAQLDQKKRLEEDVSARLASLESK